MAALGDARHQATAARADSPLAEPARHADIARYAKSARPAGPAPHADPARHASSTRSADPAPHADTTRHASSARSADPAPLADATRHADSARSPGTVTARHAGPSTHANLKQHTGIERDADPAFRADVLAGLSSSPRAIPARWFYDRRGSELFEDITRLPEYYLTRAERSILSSRAADIAELTGPGHVVVEFGSGSSAKTPLILSAVAPSAYVPIDISGDFLRDSVDALSQQFPTLPIHPIEGNFMHRLALPPVIGAGPRLGFFPGSTIGNMNAPDAVNLLRAMWETLGEGAKLIIGIDRIKSPDVLLPAYDDARGVTAEFNLNLLHRINRELRGTIPTSAFRHVARWNDTQARIEMHLEATRDLSFTVDGHPFSMLKGETIHTENSYKYGPRDARLLLRSAGWTPVAEWTDRDELFGLILAEARVVPAAP